LYELTWSVQIFQIYRADRDTEGSYLLDKGLFCMKKEGLLMGVKKEKGRKRFRKRKTYGNQILPLELLIEKNKREIINSAELMEEIYMKIDEKHTQCVTKYKKTR
jgi:hypothetical protein